MEGHKYPDVKPLKLEGSLAAVIAEEAKVTRKKEPDSLQLRKNGVLAHGIAVYCHESEMVDGTERVRISHPCEGWMNKADVVLGQVVVVNSSVGATVRESIDFDSKVVGELPFDARAFVVEKATTRENKLRARIIDPMTGWISVRCVLPIVDQSGDLRAAGRNLIEPKDVDGGSMAYSHYMELDVDEIYKNLWNAGLMYGPNFRMLKRAWRTDHDAKGIVGPLKEEADGWLVHPALADSMLHLTTCAPSPPEGGWPWEQAAEEIKAN